MQSSLHGCRFGNLKHESYEVKENKEKENLAAFREKIEQSKVCMKERLIKVKRDVVAEALVPGRIRELDSWKRTVCKRYV